MKINKAILITGASTGIGRATTEYLSSKNYIIYAGARKESNLKELDKIPNVFPIKLDVTSDNDIEIAYNYINEQNTELFGIVNNAGVAIAGPLMDVEVSELRKQFEVNFFGVHKITKKFFPLIHKAKGRIIMMSSDSGFFATPFFGPYCASKFALEGYSDSLRRELMLHNVKVILIEPGRISTPIWNKGEKVLEEFKKLDSIFKEEGLKIGEYAIEKGKTSGLDPLEVAKIVYKALISKNPKSRYLIAEKTAKYRMIKLLPARIVDNMIKKELEE